MSRPPPLSVVVSTTHPWPFLRPCLDVLLPQCDRLGAEILIADCTAEGVPADLPTAGAKLRHVVIPGASVFALRARATAEAGGSIIAWLEDHCIPAPDWCQRILEAHESDPNAGVVAGAVLNGSQETSLDWANYLCTLAPFLPPMTHAPGRGPAVANLSLRRDVVPPGPLRAGWIETRLLEKLVNSRRARFDDRPQTTHFQSMGLRGTFTAHFHNGRSTTGMLADTVSVPRRLWRMVRCLRTPPTLLLTAVRPLLGRRSIPWVRALPYMFGLSMAFAVGEFAGLVTASAGRSPELLE